MFRIRHMYICVHIMHVCTYDGVKVRKFCLSLDANNFHRDLRTLSLDNVIGTYDDDALT